MRHRIILGAMLGMFSAACSSPQAGLRDRAAIDAHIRACARDWAASAYRDTRQSVDRCIADDYEGVSSRSVVRNKPALMADSDPDPEINSDLVDYVRIRHPQDGMAIAQGGETITFRDGRKLSLIWTDVYLLRAGKWQIVTSQDSRLATPYVKS